MNPTQIIADILAKKPRLRDVFFAACGGSLVDFYPAQYLINNEGQRLHAGIYPSAEFINTPPRRLSADSLTVVCSHNGSTAESLGAASLAKERRSTLVTLTFKPGSPIEEQSDYRLSYPWGPGSPVRQQPMALGLSLASALLASVDGYAHHKQVLAGNEGKTYYSTRRSSRSLTRPVNSVVCSTTRNFVWGIPTVHLFLKESVHLWIRRNSVK